LATKQIIYKNQPFLINYEILNLHNNKDIIFLHGWGANKDIMKNSFSEFFSEFRQIYIDLPGFGKSTIAFSLTSRDYANIVKNLLDSLNSDYFIIVGHSFGGKIASILNPVNLVLLSTAGIIEKKSFKVKLKIFLAKILNKLNLSKLAKFFRSKDVKGSNEIVYDTFKNVIKEDFKDIFSSITSNTVIFWGKEDRAVSLKSGKTISSLIKRSKFYELGGDHYFFLKHNNFISQTIKDNICNT